MASSVVPPPPSSASVAWELEANNGAITATGHFVNGSGTGAIRPKESSAPKYVEFGLTATAPETPEALTKQKQKKKKGSKGGSGALVVGIAYGQDSATRALAGVPGLAEGTEGFSSADGTLYSKKLGSAPSAEPNSVAICPAFHPSVGDPAVVVGVGVLASNPKDPNEGLARFYTVNGVCVAQKFLSPPFDRPSECELLVSLKGSGFTVSVNAGESPFVFSEANTAMFSHRRQQQLERQAAEAAEEEEEDEADHAEAANGESRPSKAGGKKQSHHRKGKSAKKGKHKHGKHSPPKKAKGNSLKQGSAEEDDFVPAPPKRTAWSVFWALLLLLFVAVLIGTWASRHDPSVAKGLAAVDEAFWKPIAGEYFVPFWKKALGWPIQKLSSLTA